MPAAGAWRSTPSRTGCASRPTTGARPFAVLAEGTAAAPAHEWYLRLRPRPRGRARARRRRRQSARRDPPDRAGAGRAPSPWCSRRRTPRRSTARRRGRGASPTSPTCSPAGARAQPAGAPGWVDRLALAADQFIVRRPLAADPDAMSVIAGYHWFGDWGRDTMVSLPGLCLCTGRRRGGAAHPDHVRALRRPGHAPERVPRFRGEARIQYRRRRALVRRGGARLSRGDAGRRPGEGAVPGAGGHDRLAREGHALRHRRGRGRRPPARGRARRAGHVDGREGRRPGRDAAHRQARRDQCPLVQCAPRHGALSRGWRAGTMRPGIRWPGAPRRASIASGTRRPARATT